MKRTNKNINRALDYVSIIEDRLVYESNVSILLMTIKEIVLKLREEIFRYRNRIGRLKNEVSRLNKIIGELNGSSS